MEEDYPQGTVPTRFWHTIPDGRVQCDLCPRQCKLHDGQQGLCFVRANRGGEVVLTSYGRSGGFCVDPIEKKPLYHFLPGSPVLSFGTAGCNLACKYCQNWDMTRSREMDRMMDRALPDDLAAAAGRLGCASVAYTYNDPVIFLEYAVDTAEACRTHGIRSVAVTSGYISPGAREAFFAPMDAANVDLKSFSDEFYRKLCGGRLEPVLDTLRYIRHETRVWLELTTLIIPGHNDADAEIDAMTRWVADELGPDVPMHFSAFHPDWKMREVPPTPTASLRRARAIAMANGVRYAYTGNVHDPGGAATCCHVCGDLLIGRDGYEITDWSLTPTGGCRRCGTICAGLFAAGPGRWGSRRMPVRLAGG